MQNRYVADIGDYVKLAILRALAQRRRRLGVAWWIFPDEKHNADGGHREYLKLPDQWRQFDPCLFEYLAAIDRAKKRDVGALEEAACLSNAIFVRDPVPCDVRPFTERPANRERWLSRIRERLEDCDLIFLDPDNGIAPERLKLTWRRAGKSVMIEEIQTLKQSHRAILVYHHQTHRKGGHHAEIRDLAGRLTKKAFQVSGVLRAKPWSPRVFFILNGDRELQNRAEKIAKTWDGRIAWYPDL